MGWRGNFQKGNFCRRYRFCWTTFEIAEQTSWDACFLARRQKRRETNRRNDVSHARCKLKASTTECEGRKMSLLRECVRELRILRGFRTSNQVDTYQWPEKLTAGHFHLDLTKTPKQWVFFGICQWYRTSLRKLQMCYQFVAIFWSHKARWIWGTALRCVWIPARRGHLFEGKTSFGLRAWFFCF